MTLFSQGRRPEAGFVPAKTPALPERGAATRKASYTVDQGYQAGLQDFCTPARGFQYGRQGGYYQNNCPPTLEPGFMINTAWAAN